MMQYQANSVGLIVVAARQSENEESDCLPISIRYIYSELRKTSSGIKTKAEGQKDYRDAIYENFQHVSLLLA